MSTKCRQPSPSLAQTQFEPRVLRPRISHLQHTQCASGVDITMLARTSLGSRTRYALRYFVIPTTLTGTSLILLKDWFLEVTWITGSSMSPGLSPDYEATQRRDVMLWKKWNPERNLHRGDVILFSTPHKPDGLGVKRVVALGGDTVLLDRKRRPKDAENGRPNPAAKKWDIWKGKVVVPEGHVWVEGDNWRSTLDSNDYGPMSKSLILGKAICLLRPWNQIGTRPWEGLENKTRVIEGQEAVRRSRNDDMCVWEPHG